MDMQTEHIDDLVEGYALGALDVTDRTWVEHHAAECPPCEQQIRTAEETAHFLSFAAAPVVPPLTCKRKLLERLERERFLSSPGRRGRAALPLATWATVATVTLLVLTGAWGMRMQNQLTQAQTELALAQNEIGKMRTQMTQFASYDETIAQADAVRELQGMGAATGAQAKAYMTPGQNEALLVISGLPPLPANQFYKVWVARDTEQAPLNAFNLEQAQSAARIAIRPPRPMDWYTAIMVTVETDPNTTTPSNTTVLQGNL